MSHCLFKGSFIFLFFLWPASKSYQFTPVLIISSENGENVAKKGYLGWLTCEGNNTTIIDPLQTMRDEISNLKLEIARIKWENGAIQNTNITHNYRGLEFLIRNIIFDFHVKLILKY